jgi:hypothetical protein
MTRHSSVRPRLALGAILLALGWPALAESPAAEPPAPRDYEFYMSVGYDHGSTKLVTVTFQDGSTDTLRANGGFTLAAGASFLPMFDRRLWTRATLGLKYDSVGGGNGGVSYLAIPLELVEWLDLRHVGVGAGASISLWPRVWGSGFGSSIAADFDPSLGILVEAAYRYRTQTGWGFVAGPRFLLQKLRVKGKGDVMNANAVGLVFALSV